MNHPSPYSPPLTPLRFYILLALAQTNLHGYAIAGSIYNLSQGTIQIKDGSLYPLLRRMSDEGLIDILGHEPGKASPKAKIGLGRHGLLVLKADLERLRHAVKVADALGFKPKPTDLPLDIQKLLLDTTLT